MLKCKCQKWVHSSYVIHLLYLIDKQALSLPFATYWGNILYQWAQKKVVLLAWNASKGNELQTKRLWKLDDLQYKCFNYVWNTVNTQGTHQYTNYCITNRSKQKTRLLLWTWNWNVAGKVSTLNRAQKHWQKIKGSKYAEKFASLKAQCIVKWCCDKHK